MSEGTRIQLTSGDASHISEREAGVYEIPKGAKVIYPGQHESEAAPWGQAFDIKVPRGTTLSTNEATLAACRKTANW